MQAKVLEGDSTAIVSFQSAASRFSERVINDLTRHLITGHVRVVDRQNLDAIHAEQAYQASGFVSDESAVSIGHELGAAAIIVGSGENMVDYYRFNFRMLSVETAEILMQSSINVRYDSAMRRLLGEKADVSSMGTTHFAVGARLGAGFEINTAHEDMVGDGYSPNEKSNTAFNAALAGAFRFNDVWSVQPEVNFMLNNGMEISGQGEAYSIAYPTFDIPLLVRCNFIQAPLVVGVVVGPYISFPAGKLNLTIASGGSALDMSGYTFGITGGFAIGIKAGPGCIAADIRYLNDFNSLQVREEFDDGSGTQDQNILIRRSINVTVGYEFSL
ncbi:MAG: outer membrane beta-barrel protein [Treponema sp.]|nr:outer membrane beta-barrel protein [Treponema sp.]